MKIANPPPPVSTARASAPSPRRPRQLRCRQENQGARTLLATTLADHPQLLKRWVDGGFNGPEFAARVQTRHPALVAEAVKRLAEVPGFHVLPKRWVVRTHLRLADALPPPAGFTSP